MPKELKYWCVTYLVEVGENNWVEQPGFTNDREVFEKCLTNSLFNPNIDRVWTATEEECGLKFEEEPEEKITTVGLKDALVPWENYVKSQTKRSDSETPTKGGG
ncbi:hypothetical protein Alg130_07624 [Pyrenophora tritici-repentis]|uniref:Uncharacterized protein n=1 Tax=Pyrenophora tritici-repentis TaxID=45151 RepID=A0A834VMY7_9PLEO|nr:hypothetical protein PtrM4_130470 [Pyrenophora tritici-repentis]KAI0579171.1 hypothetical protein Alg130_07624 [Pyrenophora tritici-repentis]